MRTGFLILFALLLSEAIRAQDSSNVVLNDVLIVSLRDTSVIYGQNVGSIKFRDKILTSNCSWYEVLDALTYQAKGKGGNVMKITAVKPPDKWMTCYRVTADIYEVPDIHPYETQVDWSPVRKLSIADFKGKPRTDAPKNYAAETAAGFVMQTNRVTPFKTPKFIVFSRFDCYKSWIGEESKGKAEILEHEQSHFDINEIYARQLRKALHEGNFNIDNLEESNELFNRYYKESREQQEQYDTETVHGTNKKAQAKWNDMIRNELKRLEAYQASGWY